jgi:hypothetical protein
MPDVDQALSREIAYNAFLPKPISWPQLAALLAEHLQLDWEYAGPRAQQEDGTILLAPDRDELAILFDLAMKGNLTGLEKRAADLEQRDPRLRPFGQKLRQLAHAFEEDELIAFVAPYMEQAR